MLTKIILICLLISYISAQWGHGHQHHHHHQQQQKQNKPDNKYYDAMGLKRNANDAEIKKAYKKLAIRFHPDKNPDDPETAKAKFQEVSNAYEILSDPEKRRVYDQTGTEGVKEHEQRQGQQQHHGHGDFFGHHFHQQEQRVPDLFENVDVFKLDMENLGTFYRRKEIWIIYFYNPKLQECQQFKDQYITASEKLYGIIKVAGINCLYEEEICEEFSVYDVPQILIFTEKFDDDGEKYTGKKDWNALANAAARKMQSFIQSVNEQNLDSFISRDQQKSKALYFTDKKQTPAIMKSFSKKFLDKISIGEVRHTDELVKKFGVEKFPQLMIVTDIDTFAGDVYEGELKIDQIQKFLSSHASSTKKTLKKPTFQKLTEKKEQNLCSSSKLCLIVFVEEDIQIQEFTSLVEKFETDPINFTYIVRGDSGFRMQQSHFQNHIAVLIKPKKQKWLPIEASFKDRMKESIESALGGNGQWKKYQPLDFKTMITIDDL